MLQNKEYDIVEVKRGRRSESMQFRILYQLYKLSFRFITGKSLNYGNFCMLKQHVVKRLRYTSFIHLPANLLKHKGSRSNITFNRSPRIEGKSKMRYKDLFLHAFKSFVEFGDDLLLWFLRLFAIISIPLIATFVNLVYQKFVAHTAILGWFSVLSLGLFTLAIVCIGFFVIGILLINLMHNRSYGMGKTFSVILKQQQND
jgi:hypothetical protein